jgi:creatinine amidohydrolase
MKKKTEEALMFWKDLCEGDFDEAVTRSDGLCVIPVGCFEMHGKHLPVGTDVYEAEAVAAEMAKLEEAVVFPAFEFGDVAGLVDFKGGVNLDPILRLQLLENYCEEISRHGFDKILLLNYHGGNPAFLTYFMNMLEQKPRAFTALSCFPVPLFVEEIWPTIKEKGGAYYPELLPEDIEVIRDHVENGKLDGHGGLLETAMMLAIRPDLVNLDALGKVSGLPTHNADRLAAAGLQSTVFWYLNFPNGGYCGHDPVAASARIGKLLVRLSAEKAANAARVFKEENARFVDLREHKKPFYDPAKRK